MLVQVSDMITSGALLSLACMSALAPLHLASFSSSHTVIFSVSVTSLAVVLHLHPVPAALKVHVHDDVMALHLHLVPAALKVCAHDNVMAS